MNVLITVLLAFVIQNIILVFFTFFVKKQFSLMIYVKSFLISAIFLIIFLIYHKFTNFIDLLTISIIMYFMLSFIFYNMLNANVGSLRVRMLYEIDRGISLRTLVNRYNSNDIIKIRLIRLSNNKQIIIKKNLIYLVSKKILFIFYFFYYGKKIFYKKIKPFE